MNFSNTHDANMDLSNDLGIDFSNYSFGRIEPVALEQTLADLNAYDLSSMGDFEGSYGAMVDEVVMEKDWLDVAFEAEAEEMRAFGMGDAVGAESLGLGDALQDEASESRSLDNGATVRYQTKHNMEYTCIWASCIWSSTLPADVQNHITEHREIYAQSWSRGCQCLWLGCKSKASFFTKKLFLSHLANKHTDPLLCAVRGCRYKKAFRDQNDLKRHINTKHESAQRPTCPYDNCDSSGTSFARVDKLLKHIRDVQHQNDAYCPFPHCNAEQIYTDTKFESRAEISTHFGQLHSHSFAEGFECRLSSCMERGDSKWSRRGLQMHLIEAHGPFSHINYRVACDYVTLRMDYHRALTDELILSIIPRLPDAAYRDAWRQCFHDCNICAPSSLVNE